MKNLTTGLRNGLRQSIAGGLGAGDIFSTASLDLNFAKYKNLGQRVDATTGSNLVDFTRASSGTYVGSDGLIKTAVTNLLLQSEDFSTTWTTTNASILSNQIFAPNGTLTADKLVEGTSADFKNVTQSFAFANSKTYSFSVYGKSAENSVIQLGFGGGGQYATVAFDVSSGIVGTVTSSSWTDVSGLIEDHENGWYRCVLVATSSNSVASNSVFVRNTVENDLGDGTSGIYIWGAQLEQSSTVGEYVKTTSTINSAPRFDHDPTTGESLGLLVEESRTNLLLRSEEFDDSSWTKTRTTVTANAAIAPDGSLTADKLVENTDNNSHVTSQNATVSSGAVCSLSVFVKADERFSFVLSIQNSTNQVRAFFNLSTLAVTTIVSGTGALTGTSIIDFGAGWYRVVVTGALSGTTTYQTEIRLLDGSGNESYTGDGTSGLYLWGAQLEAGSFPTSYIPTEGSTVTRAADVASITGSNFSSWYRQDEGTVFADSARYALGNSAGQYIVCEAGNSANNNNELIQLGTQFGSNNFQLLVNVGNVTQVALVEAGVVAPSKYVGAYRVNDFAYTKNGASPATDTSGTTPTVSQLNIGSRPAFGNTGYLNGTISRLTYWPTRLGNDTLQTITQ